MADGDDIEQKIKLTWDDNAKKTAKNVDKLDSSIDKTTKSQKESTKATKKNKEGLDDLGGGIGNAIRGFKGLIKQAWLLVANPVGLIIAAIALALTGLFKAFTSTKAGAEKFDQIMAGIGATIDVLRDRVLKIAGAIAKFFSGDFAGALADGKAAVSGFGDEVAAEFRKAADATRSLQEVADAMRDLGVSRAKLNRDLVRAKEIINDETSSYNDKKIAIEEVQKAETEQTEKELANAQKKLDAIKVQNALSDSSSEDLQAQADAESALFNIQQKSAEDRVKNLLLIKKANNEEKTRLKELVIARDTANKERQKIVDEEQKETERIADLKLKTEESLQKSLEDLEDKTEEDKLQRRREREEARLEALAKEGVDTREALILNNELFNELEDELREKRKEENEEREATEREKKLEDEQKLADEQIRVDQAVFDQKKAIEEAKIGLLGKAVSLARAIFGKNKKLQKGVLLAENALGIAKTIISTQASNATAIAEGAALAIPSAGASVVAASALVTANTVSAGISIAGIIAATAAGLKELGGGSAGSASNIRRGGASSAPQVGFQASSENQIATTIAENTNDLPPVEAFVVESQVTTTQALARKKAEDNSFG